MGEERKNKGGGAADFNPPQWPCAVGYQLLYSNQMRLVSLIRTVPQSYYMQFGVTKLSFIIGHRQNTSLIQTGRFSR